MSEFLTLPSELIELIGEASNTQDDLLALSWTCKSFYTLLKPRLIPYNIKNYQSSGLRAAARLNDMDLAREFLNRKGVDVNSTVFRQFGIFETPLLLAMEYEYEDMALLLLEHGANPKIGAGKYIPDLFFEACTSDKLQVVRKLVEMGCVTDFRRRPLSNFTVRSLPVLEILLQCFDAQSLSNSEGQLVEMLWETARDGAVDVIQALLARGVPVNPPSSWLRKPRAPLYGAVTGASPEAASLLLQNGADLCYDLCDLVRVFRPWMLWPQVDEDTKRRLREILEVLQFAAASVADDTYRARVQGVLEWVLQYIEV